MRGKWKKLLRPFLLPGHSPTWRHYYWFEVPNNEMLSQHSFQTREEEAKDEQQRKAKQEMDARRESDGKQNDQNQLLADKRFRCLQQEGSPILP